MTKSLGNVDPVTTSRPSYSGYRKRTFTQEFLTYLATGKSAQSFSNDPVQPQYAMKKVKDQVLEDKESVKLLVAGTTSWESFDGRHFKRFQSECRLIQPQSIWLQKMVERTTSPNIRSLERSPYLHSICSDSKPMTRHSRTVTGDN